MPKMKPKSILFIDPPAFCTTVESMVAPALRSRPIVIAPPGADRATILALSSEAREAGITQGMLLPKARKICPDLIILPPNPRLYARASRALHDVLRRYAPLIEPRGYGHAFLDVSGTDQLFGPPVDLAERIRRETRDQIRLPLSVAVATNKLVSETAIRADRHTGVPADGRHISPLLEVEAGHEATFLSPLNVEVMPDIPDRMREQLDDYQLDFIGEIAVLTEQQAYGVFGRPGLELVARSRGIDPRPVLPPALKAEFTMTHTLASDTNDLGVLLPLLRRMSERLGQRLRARHLASRRLVVDLAYSDYKQGKRHLALAPALLDVELWNASRHAFMLANTRPVSIRSVTLTVDRLVEADAQLDLFWSVAWEGGKGGGGEVRKQGNTSMPPRHNEEGSLQSAIDRITNRWGNHLITHGSTFSLIADRRSRLEKV
jgi:DNA polymerase-4